MPRLCRQALSLLRGPAVSTNRLRYHVGNQGVSRQPSFCRCGGVAWSLFRATHDVPTVWALVYRGCPCWDPPVCPPMPRQDGIGSKAPTLCMRSVRPPVVLSSFANVFVILVFCDMLEMLTPLLDDKRCIASSLSFPTVSLLTSIVSWSQDVH